MITARIALSAALSAALPLLYASAAPARRATLVGSAADTNDAEAAKKALDEGVELAKKDKYDEAVDRFRKAADLFKSANDEAGQVDALVRAGSLTQYFLKHDDKALELYASALAVARVTKDRDLLVRTLGEVGSAQKLLGHKAESVAAYTEALSLCEAAADYQGVVATLSNIGSVYRSFGDAAKADEYRARAEKVRAEHGVRPLTVRVSGGVLATRAKHKETPVYPPEASKAGVHGSVVVEVTVGTDGKIERARATSGPAELQQAAIDAAKQWTFEPTLLSGQPVRVIGTITFAFK